MGNCLCRTSDPEESNQQIVLPNRTQPMYSAKPISSDRCFLNVDAPTTQESLATVIIQDDEITPVEPTPVDIAVCTMPNKVHA
ncbi:hypothetical protein FPOAC2_07808 [Fusarium poae]|uniref:hypothetical protein n=1 Tax=Fusarium poae TaxID=36050 RepID=UPI001CE930B0|nr:hypothetical protein FPOAC1_007900 [Fusarium poae]KAG8668517.1 hypothetical protein FPOAC1_007900 [Fusarium poae]